MIAIWEMKMRWNKGQKKELTNCHLFSEVIINGLMADFFRFFLSFIRSLCAFIIATLIFGINTFHIWRVTNETDVIDSNRISNLSLNTKLIKSNHFPFHKIESNAVELWHSNQNQNQNEIFISVSILKRNLD